MINEEWREGICSTCIDQVQCFIKMKDPEGYGKLKSCAGYNNPKGGEQSMDNKSDLNTLVPVIPKRTNNNQGHPRFYEIVEHLMDLHSAKDQDYSGKKNPLSNLKECEDMGIPSWIGVGVRLSDKWSRFKNFCKNRKLEVKDESIKETLMDMAGYSVLAIILLEEEEKK